jgi:hypothetical protein
MALPEYRAGQLRLSWYALLVARSSPRPYPPGESKMRSNIHDWKEIP